MFGQYVKSEGFDCDEEEPLILLQHMNCYPRE